jgi:hypothetical protein
MILVLSGSSCDLTGMGGGSIPYYRVADYRLLHTGRPAYLLTMGQLEEGLVVRMAHGRILLHLD